MGSNFLQAEVMTTLWNMFQLVSTRGQSTVHCYIQMKIAIPQGPASSASYSLKTALNSSLHCVPGWMICDYVTLLQRIAQIFPLKAAPGPPSIFHGTENSSEDTTTTSRCQIFSEMIICTYIYGFLHGGYWHYVVEGRTLNLASDTWFLPQLPLCLWY